MRMLNCLSARDKMRSYLKHPGSFVLMLLVMLGSLGDICSADLSDYLYSGQRSAVYETVPVLVGHYTSENASGYSGVINTVSDDPAFLLSQFRLESSQPFFWWNMQRGNKFVDVIRLTTETLSGIPSIVYGLFGMLFFVNALDWGFSIWQERLHCLL